MAILIEIEGFMPIVLIQYNNSEKWSGVNALESVDKL